MNAIKNVILIIIIILLLMFGIRQQLEINSLNEKLTEQDQRLEEVRQDNEKKENMLNMTDEEYIEKHAADYGFRYPGAQYFYNDFGN